MPSVWVVGRGMVSEGLRVVVLMEVRTSDLFGSWCVREREEKEREREREYEATSHIHIYNESSSERERESMKLPHTFTFTMKAQLVK